MSSMFAAMLGLPSNHHLLVGIEVDSLEPHLFRVYIDHRAYGRYVLVGAEEAERLSKAWGTMHAYVEIPPDALVYREVAGDGTE